MTDSSRTLVFAMLVLSLAGCETLADDVNVGDVASLRQAVLAAKPGTRILVAPGDYAGGMYFQNIRGEEGKPIIIMGADPAKPPRFVGGNGAMQLSDCSYLELRDLAVTGQTANGLNIDDGGSFDTPAHHIILERVQVSDVGPTGNRDGIKMSGVDDFVVKDCKVERWGDGGSGIDMVGCHRGRIEGCTFRAREGRGSSAVQTKGGSRDVVIRKCLFDHAGGRAANVGGSTGLQYFRPKVEGFEAKDIRVEGNIFVGGDAPFAFVGVDGAVARFNTVYVPDRYAIRILQETTGPEFVPCRNVIFSDNLIVFSGAKWFTGGVNIGPNTAPETFRFERNFWYCIERPDRSKPTLPSEEKDGVYGVDPQFVDAEKGDFTLKPGSPAKAYGHTALPPEEKQPR